jgi:hypothetical protein
MQNVGFRLGGAKRSNAPRLHVSQLQTSVWSNAPRQASKWLASHMPAPHYRHIHIGSMNCVAFHVLWPPISCTHPHRAAGASPCTNQQKLCVTKYCRNIFLQRLQKLCVGSGHESPEPVLIAMGVDVVAPIGHHLCIVVLPRSCITIH